MSRGNIAVIDIGKTNAKVALVAGADLSEIDVATQPNVVVREPPYPHFDVEAIWRFVLEALARYHAQHGIDSISITTHGACAALLGVDGRLAAPVLDYEHNGPDAVAETYDALRPAFAETGSPRLPGGLNLGAQFHWQFQKDPTLSARTHSIVTYPQYWGYRLTGALACDVSSLGCHTDLWNPHETRYSTLADHLNIAGKIAPARNASDVLGLLRPELASETDLSPETEVLVGIHDSNASLLPHVMHRAPPFSVVSTGTWVIAMTLGGRKVTLDPVRDTLINVHARGAPVPSARFMGGREYEMIWSGDFGECATATLIDVAKQGLMLLPAVVSDSGPYQGRAAQWMGAEPEQGRPQRLAALSFYLAMMTAECLSLTGHEGPIIVEGPFTRNTGYCAMLAAATGCEVEPVVGQTGTSLGAALLSRDAHTSPKPQYKGSFSPQHTPAFVTYATRWRKALQSS